MKRKFAFLKTIVKERVLYEWSEKSIGELNGTWDWKRYKKTDRLL
jgi:hypothetical protein